MQKKDKKSPGDQEYVLVYSSDPKPEKKSASSGNAYSSINPTIAFERKGRGGKSVTLLKRLPAHETLLAELCKFLKRRLGTGGTSYLANNEGVIEIQGEHQEALRSLVEEFKASKKASLTNTLSHQN